jgi:queuine tRNA-ribosyltransferase
VQVQNALGADIIMAFDDCPPAAREAESDQGDGPTDTSASGMTRHAVAEADYPRRNRDAADRTARWLERCVQAHARPNDQALFGIVQGGLDLELRRRCVDQVCQHDLPGYAIGGCAVGEGHEAMVRVVEHTAPLLPEDRPRYLMGVGYERDILGAVAAGVDMFDCVLPTRNGRNANAFVPGGQMRLRNAQFADDSRPIDPQCDCPACRQFTRAYLRHLFIAQEMLGPILVSLHNIRFFQRLMLDIRRAIEEDNGSFLARRGREAS